MTHPRKPRSVLAQLLEAAKWRRGCDWPEIDAQIGLIKSTRESWLNGNVKDPSLKGVMTLARVLDIKPDELEKAVLEDKLPRWAERLHALRDAGWERPSSGALAPGAAPAAPEGMAAKAAGREGRAWPRRDGGRGRA